MTDTTAKIRAKGLDSTGVTEEIANNLYANKGKRIVAIVELHAVERHEKADGTRRVDLVLEQVEPAVDDAAAEYLRELTRAMYVNRQQAQGQLAIDGTLDNEPTVEGVLAAGGPHRLHPFLPDDASSEIPICDVCGKVETASIHHTDVDDPFETDPGESGGLVDLDEEPVPAP